MEQRRIKQLIYGAVFLGIIFLVIFGVYFIWLKPAPTCFDSKQNQGETGIDCGGPCAPCEQKYAKNLDISWVKNFSNADDKIVLVAEIKNPNLNYGAGDFVYSFDIYNKFGEKAKTISDQSFIYNGEVKYLIKAIDFKPQDFSKSELSFSQFVWKSKDDFKKPQVRLKEFKTNISTSQQSLVPFYTFTRNLYSGIKGEDVKFLEEFLKSQGFFTGAPDNSFNSTTKSSLIKYQKANNLLPATGYFDSKTRNFINSQIEKIKSSVSETAAVYPVTVDGTVKNDDVIKISKIIVNSFVFDNLGIMMSASKTELENLNPGDEKSFRIIFPQNIDVKSVNPNLTKVYVDAIR